jgi:hypothetical protein
MTWTVPMFSRTRVDAAGDMLVSAQQADLIGIEEYESALSVINNWRASHSFPLNTFKLGLMDRTAKVDPKGLVAQRIKRLSSIQAKLARFPGMKLSRMQDIAGCRSIVTRVSHVRELVALYQKKRGLKHELHREDDYIAEPKESGYRGYHLEYRYYSDRQETYNDLSVVVQLRTQLQHTWATAVETVGTFVQQALKSSQGEQDWLRFFALMGTAIAMLEKTALVPRTCTRKSDLRAELREYAKKLDVENRLMAFGTALQITAKPGKEKPRYFVVELDFGAKTLHIRGYNINEFNRASDDYQQTERKITGMNSDAVLVSVQSLRSLRRAYPNYYLDTHAFISLVNETMK